MDEGRAVLYILACVIISCTVSAQHGGMHDGDAEDDTTCDDCPIVNGTWGDAGSCFCVPTSCLTMECEGVNQVPTFNEDSKYVIIKFKQSELGTIPPRAFASLSGLHDLYIDFSGVTELLSDSFAGMAPSLEIAVLSGNLISHLPANVFQDMRGLVLVRYNQIKSIHKDAYKNYVASRLSGGADLQGNLLETFEDIDISTLVDVDLENNQLVKFDSDIRNLKSLKLKNNKLASIPDKLLRNAFNLRYMYLNNNKLTSFPVDSLVGLNVTRLQLHDNPLPCSLKGEIEKVYAGELTFPDQGICTAGSAAVVSTSSKLFSWFTLVLVLVLFKP